jgi:chromate transporter
MVSLGFREIQEDAEVGNIPELTFFELFKIFLWFGCRAFGGPVAQIALMKQELVTEQKWISNDKFNRVYAVYQILPGPEVIN